MTVASTTNRKTFTGDGVTLAFATSPVVFFDASDLAVYVVTTATGAAVLQTLTTNYSVTGGAGSTGTVTMLVAPASTEKLVIVRTLPLTQGTDFVNNDASDAEVAERALDRATMVDQQLAARIDRAISIPSADVAGTTVELPAAGLRAGKYLGFDGDGNAAALDGSDGTSGALAVALAASSGSSLVGFIQSGTGAVAETVQSGLRGLGVRPEQYGAVGDGVADDSTAWTNALAAIANGGTLICTAGAIYKFASQVTVTGPSTGRICILGFGAEIQTSGAISGLNITGGNTTGGVSVYGIRVNHRGNTSATYGFYVSAGWRVHFYDCFVEAHGVGASYAAFRIANSDPSNNNTGSFWTKLVNCGCRKRSGSDSGDIPIGVLLQGAANATTILGGSYANTTTGVKITYHAGYTYIANGVLIDGAAFEGFTTGISVVQETTVPVTGLRIIGNRVESGTTFVSLTGATTQPLTPTYLAGNYLVGGGGNITYLSNTNSLYVTVLDEEVSAGGVTPSFVSQDGVTIRSTSGSAHPLTIKTNGGGRGISILQGASFASVGTIGWYGVSNQMLVRSTSTDQLFLSGVKGISNNAATNANNLRGSVTFASAGTKAVAFATAEADAAYYVVVTGNANESFWVTAKTTAGFTINSSNATSAAAVDWILIR